MPDIQVSVVITCYNYGKYLSGCLSSVLSQTYDNFEIVVVNDGSTDNTDHVMKSFVTKPKIKYIQQANAGQANAKNVGIKYSKGKYVAFLDADDQWKKDKLAKQLKLFNDKKVGVVYSRARYIDEAGRGLDFKLKGKYLRPQRGKVTDFLFFDNFVPFSSSVVRRVCFEQFGVFDESLRMGIDWDLWLRLSTVCDFDFVDEPLLVYRLGHTGQMSKNTEERQRCSDRIIRNFTKRYPKSIKKNNLRKALAYTYINRGTYCAHHDLAKAYRYFARAYFKWPLSLTPLRGMIKTFIKAMQH